MNIRLSGWLALMAAMQNDFERGILATRAPYVPTPEKYPGQRQAFRRGAWQGDGVVPDPLRARGRKCPQP